MARPVQPQRPGHPASSKSTDKKTAVLFLRRIIGKQQQGRHGPDAAKVTLADLRRLVEDDHLLKGPPCEGAAVRGSRRLGRGVLEAHFGAECLAACITLDQLKKYAGR